MKRDLLLSFDAGSRLPKLVENKTNSPYFWAILFSVDLHVCRHLSMRWAIQVKVSTNPPSYFLTSLENSNAAGRLKSTIILCEPWTWFFATSLMSTTFSNLCASLFLTQTKISSLFFEKWELVYFDSQRGRRLALCVYTDRLPLVLYVDGHLLRWKRTKRGRDGELIWRLLLLLPLRY